MHGLEINDPVGLDELDDVSAKAEMKRKRSDGSIENVTGRDEESFVDEPIFRQTAGISDGGSWFRKRIKHEVEDNMLTRIHDLSRNRRIKCEEDDEQPVDDMYLASMEYLHDQVDDTPNRTGGIHRDVRADNPQLTTRKTTVQTFAGVREKLRDTERVVKQVTAENKRLQRDIKRLEAYIEKLEKEDRLVKEKVERAMNVAEANKIKARRASGRLAVDSL